jgi:hypothetical protein
MKAETSEASGVLLKPTAVSVFTYSYDYQLTSSTSVSLVQYINAQKTPHPGCVLNKFS